MNVRRIIPSKVYYIITHYLDLCVGHGVNDSDYQMGLYMDIVNGCNGSVYTQYENASGKKWLSYADIRSLAEEKTKKEIDEFFYNY